MSNQVLSITGRTSRSPASKPFKNLNINIPEENSETSTLYTLGKNSPTGISRSPQTFSLHRLNTLSKPPAFSFSPTSASPPKIKSPSKYVFSTHNHSRIFASKSPQTENSKPPTPRSKLSRSATSAQLSKTPSVKSIVTSVAQKSPESLYRDHLYQTFQALKFVRNVRQVDYQTLSRKVVYLPKRRGYENKKTVVFDLDETLVHCVDDPRKGHCSINIDFPTGERIQAGLNIRPYAREVLQAANKDFEVIVFTASHKCYADKALDCLDPTGELIHHRLYRENCIQVDGVYIKDLRILARRRLEDILIIDNAAYSFAYQLDNGVPIISWYSDMSDKELNKLIDYLKAVSRVNDVRAVNRQTFHLDTFYYDYIKDFSRQTDKENLPLSNY